MKDLHSILKAVSRGKMDVERAAGLIQELFEASQNFDSEQQPSAPRASLKKGARRGFSKVTGAKTSVDAALTQLSERVGFGTLLKRSRELSRKIEFRPEHSGFDAQLSVFSSVEVSSDSVADGNNVTGSQWKNAAFIDMAEVHRNQFTISQISNFSCARSNFSSNELGLARLCDVTVSESRFEHNRLSRSQCLDVSLTESDFTHNRLLKSELSGVVLNASRVANLVLNSSRFQECEFDQSDIQGLKFENCNFEECRFSNCEIVSTEPAILEGLKVKGKIFEGLRSVEDWLSALEYKPSQEHNAHRSAEGSQGRRPHRRQRHPRDKR
ncbi:MAG: pentapeptide repeat-containing protein [Betaproteobacteria bacterium]|nr:pentapeptide repeat-containing protein [Betaproteobacteria bacterium]